EHADALAVAGDRPAAEVERDGPAAVDDEAVARAARRGDRVGRVEPVGPDEQAAERARDGAAVDVVAAAAERAGRPGGQHDAEEREQADDADGAVSSAHWRCNPYTLRHSGDSARPKMYGLCAQRYVGCYAMAHSRSAVRACASEHTSGVFRCTESAG